MVLWRQTRKILITNFICKRKYCNQKKIRVRFAPSPTGYLHLGGLRTALYNHLFAKSQNGTTIIRIEDTDRTRIVEGASQALIDDLAWCGVQFDEGPYFQSERLHLYQEHVKTLLENDSAYKCFCTSTRLDLLRKEAVKAREVFRYDNKCRDLTEEEIDSKLKNGESFCIRFKVPVPSESSLTFTDMILGPITGDASHEGDPVIMKTDGYPTYHFANVVDDHLMEISHVLRGIEWQVSTIKHLLMYKAFGWQPPQFGHLPVLLNQDGTKLSKRNDGVRVQYLRESGILPRALVNFVLQPGGGFDLLQSEKDHHCYTIEELTNKFNLAKISKNSCKIDLERLKDANWLELKRLIKEDGVDILVKTASQYLREYFKNKEEFEHLRLDEAYIRNILLKITTDRISNLRDLIGPDFIWLWVVKDYQISQEDISCHTLETFVAQLSKVNFDEEETLKNCMREFAKSHNMKYPKFMKLLRMILTGHEQGPSIIEVIGFLGRDNVLTILNRAVNKLNKNSTNSQQININQ